MDLASLPTTTQTTGPAVSDDGDEPPTSGLFRDMFDAITRIMCGRDDAD